MDHEATLYERLMAAHDLNMRNVLMPTNTLFGEAAAELLRLTEYAGNADLLRADIGVLKAILEIAYDLLLDHPSLEDDPERRELTAKIGAALPDEIRRRVEKANGIES